MPPVVPVPEPPHVQPFASNQFTKTIMKLRLSFEIDTPPDVKALLGEMVHVLMKPGITLGIIAPSVLCSPRRPRRLWQGFR